MNDTDRDEILALAEQVEPECGQPAPYGNVVCTRPDGHPGRHYCDTLNWAAA